MQVPDYQHADTSAYISTATVESFNWTYFFFDIGRIVLVFAVGYALYRLGLWALGRVVRRSPPVRQIRILAVYRILGWIGIVLFVGHFALFMQPVQFFSLLGPAVYLLVGFGSGFAFRHSLISIPTASAHPTAEPLLSDD